MSERSVVGADVSKESETPLFEVGTVVTIGSTTYQYVKAGGTALAAYRFCYLNPVDYVTGALTTAGIAAVPAAVGVPQIAVTANYYAWVAIAGSFTGHLLASCAANAKLYTTSTAGGADDSATTHIAGVQSTATVGGAAANTVCFSAVPMSVNCV